jgi:hypothetical protein
MEEAYGKGLANHPDPELWVASREAGSHLPAQRHRIVLASTATTSAPLPSSAR